MLDRINLNFRIICIRTNSSLRSKWFLGSLGHEGLNNLLAAYPDKSAEAVCTFAYCEGPGHEPLIFQGRTEVRLPKLLEAPF